MKIKIFQRNKNLFDGVKWLIFNFEKQKMFCKIWDHRAFTQSFLFKVSTSQLINLGQFFKKILPWLRQRCRYLWPLHYVKLWQKGKNKTKKLSSQQGFAILNTAWQLYLSIKPTWSAGLTRPSRPTGSATHNLGTIYKKCQWGRNEIADF